MTQPAPDPAPAQPQTPPAEPVGGFPADTPVTEMTTEQQAAYWKHQARKHEDRARSRDDYDDLKAKAARFDQAQRKAMTDQERAVAEAREAALAEGRTQAMTELGTKYTRAFLAEALTTRGRTAEQVETVLKHTNLQTYVTDGEPDTDAIAAYADTIAGPIGAPPPGRGPDHGQGARGQQAKATGLDAGKAMFEARHGKPPPPQ